MKFKIKGKDKKELVIKLNEKDVEELNHVMFDYVSYNGCGTKIVLVDYSRNDTKWLFKFVRKLLNKAKKIRKEKVDD